MDELSPDEALPPYPGQQRPKSAVVRCLIPCCGLAFLAVVAIVGGLYVWFEGSKIEDPAKIAAMVQEVLPGDLPPGFTGKMGHKLSVWGNASRMAVFTGEDPKKLVIAVGDFPNQSPEFIYVQVLNLARFQLPALRQKPKVVEGNTIELKVHGSLLTARERIIECAGVKIREVFVVLGANTGVLFVGHQDVFDQAAMDAYLRAVVPAGSTAPTHETTAKKTAAKTAK